MIPTLSVLREITIEGRGGGGGESAQHTPVEAQDSLHSSATARILDLLCEGPIGGLVDGLKSIYLNGTPLQGPDLAGKPTYNFLNTSIYRRVGTQQQSSIEGFPSSEQSITDGRELRQATPLIITISDTTVDSVRVTIGVPNLTSSSASGDLMGTYVSLNFYLQSNGGGYNLLFNDYISGKTTSRYQRSYPIKVKSLGPGPWNIKVERVTADAASVQITNKTFIDLYTQVIDYKLRYPNCALVGIYADAKTFTSIPSRGYEIYGLLVQVPSNYTPESYNPATSTWTPASYAGTWNGSFKTAWTRNPAWCFYDLLTQGRYGLGNFITPPQVDKWALYGIGQYCDQQVPNGFGGTEPRFTCNLYLQTQAEAFQVISNIASIFRGMAYWASGTILPVQDRPTDPTYLFTEANVVDGTFTYSGIARRARHNVILVAWNDPTDGYIQKVEYCEDALAIAAMGYVSQSQVVAFGCTSRGQAHRVGQWMLITEQVETETVVFRTGYEGIMQRPGDVINIQDQSRVSTRFGGRIIDSDGTTHTLDAPVTIVSGKSYTLWCVLPDGTVVQQPVQTGPSTTATVQTAPFAQVPGRMAEWILSASDLVPQSFRVLSVKEIESSVYEVTALKYNASKYAAVEDGLALENPPDGSGGSGSGNPGGVNIKPKNFGLSEYLRISGVTVEVVLAAHWDAVPKATSYSFQWRKDHGNWNTVADTSLSSVEIFNIAAPALYAARVYATVGGIVSPPATASLNALGKTAPPANVTNFVATVQATMFQATWDPCPDLDWDHTIIKNPGAGTNDAIRWTAGVPVTGCDNLAVTTVALQRPITGSYDYWAKHVDTSGNESVSPTKLTLVVNALDDYITPSDKRDWQAEYDRLWSEKTSIDSSADSAAVSRIAYDGVLATLDIYLNTLIGLQGWLAVSAGTGHWASYTDAYYLGAAGTTGAVFFSKFKDVWTTRDTLLGQIIKVTTAQIETFRPKFLWDFGVTDPAGFSPFGFTTAAVAAPDDKTARNWGGLALGALGRFTGFTIPGADGYIVQARVRLNSGTWKGNGYQSPDGFWNYYKTMAAPPVGVWTIISWDLRTMTVGASITDQAAIQGYALELGAGSASVDVDWVAVGTYGAGSRRDYELALQDSITDLLGRGDTTVLGNTVVTGVANMFPNAYSEAATVPGTYGALNVSASAAHSGVNGRRILLAGHGVPCAPTFGVTAGDGYYLAFWCRATGGAGSGGLQALFKDAAGATVTSPSFSSFQSTSTSWVYLADQFLVPTGAVSMQLQWYSNTTVGRIIDLDEFVLRKSADSWLLVNGAVEAYFARFGGMQSNSLAVGPFLQFRATSGGLKLQGRPDGSMSRVTAADRVTYPTLGAENAADPAIYIDDTRIYPSADVMTYETRWGGTTEARGIIMNLGSAFATSGLLGLIVRWAGTALTVAGVLGIGNYSATLKAATVAAATVHDDKLTVIHYPVLQKDSTGAATIRMRVLVNGVSVLTATDTDLGTFAGALGGYAGLYMGGDVRVSNPEFGRGYVTIQDGAVKADVFMSSDYSEDGSGNPTAGFKAGFGQANPLKVGPSGLQIGTAIFNQSSVRFNRLLNGHFAHNAAVNYGSGIIYIFYNWTTDGVSFTTVILGGPMGYSAAMNTTTPANTTTTKTGGISQTFEFSVLADSAVYQPILKMKYALASQFNTSSSSTTFTLYLYHISPAGVTTTYTIDTWTDSTFYQVNTLVASNWVSKSYNIYSTLALKGPGTWTIQLAAATTVTATAGGAAVFLTGVTDFELQI